MMGLVVLMISDGVDYDDVDSDVYVDMIYKPPVWMTVFIDL